MRRSFYASGFLYHSRSNQILLQQQNSNDPKCLWSMLGSYNRGTETSEENFIRNVKDFLHLNLLTSSIRSVYDYVRLGKNYVSYAQVKKLTNFPTIGKTVFAWFNMREISKLPLSAQTKQDIIVGQRVIDASVRKQTGEQTIK